MGVTDVTLGMSYRTGGISMKLNWEKDTITVAEAEVILGHAYECLDYVGKLLINTKERPPLHWRGFLATTQTQVLQLKYWLRGKF